MNELKLELNIDDINMIFKALGNMPFKEVYELIGKINDQVNQQLKSDEMEESEE